MVELDKKSDSYTCAVHEFGEYIFTLSYRLTGSRDDADDLVQETLLRAYQKWDSLKNPGNPLPWLRRICVNLFIDAGRRPSAKQKQREVDFPSDRHEIASTALSPEEETVFSDEVRRIRSQCYTILTSTLKVPQRIAFVLVDIFQIDVKEVAILLDKSDTAVKSLLFRARRKMRRFLGNHCGLVAPEGLCRCASWIGLSGDVQRRRDMLHEILGGTPITSAGRRGINRRLKELYRTLPYLKMPAGSSDDFFSVLPD